METIIAFLGAHYIWFIIIAILLVFALIGYIVDSNNITIEKPEVMSLASEKDKEEVKQLIEEENSKVSTFQE